MKHDLEREILFSLPDLDLYNRWLLNQEEKNLLITIAFIFSAYLYHFKALIQKWIVELLITAKEKEQRRARGKYQKN
jgi:hypothetical protein